MLPVKRAPLPVPVINPSTRSLIDLSNICEKYSEDAAARAVATAVQFLLKEATDDQKKIFLIALSAGLTQYLKETGNKNFLEKLLITTMNFTIDPTPLLKSISKMIYDLLKKCGQDNNCLILLINFVFDTQKNAFSNTPREKLEYYLNENKYENKELLDELKLALYSYIINSTLEPIPEPIPEPTQPILVKDEKCPLNMPQEIFFYMVSKYLKKKNIDNLRCVSRFFAGSKELRLISEDKEGENLVWPGMDCDIEFIAHHYTQSIHSPFSNLAFITNPLGKFFIRAQKIVTLEDTNLSLAPIKIVTDNGSVFIQSAYRQDSQSEGQQWLVYGNNTFGQLGTKDHDYKKQTTLLSLPDGEKIKSVITNNGSTFIESTSGKWFVCGSNGSGQLGLEQNNLSYALTLTLLSLPNGEMIKTVITNGSSTFIESTNGKWFVCGRNHYGELGLGHENDVYALTLLLLPNGEMIKTVITNGSSTFIESTNGKWFVCGSNCHGQLGLGHKNDVYALTLLLLPNGKTIKTVITNGSSTFIQSTCKLWFVCGQLGLEHQNDRHITPFSLPKGERIKAIIPNRESLFIQGVSKQWFAYFKLDDVYKKHPLTLLSLPNGENIKTIMPKSGSTFIQSTSGQWFFCYGYGCGRLSVDHNNHIKYIQTLLLPSSFSPSLTETQTKFVESLIEIVILQKPITIADFLSKLFFAYAEQLPVNTDSFLAKEMASTLLNLSQQTSYSACVQHIQKSGVLKTAAELANVNDDSLNLLCVCKKLYDKDFLEQVKKNLSDITKSESLIRPPNR